MATVQELQRARCILYILLIINSVAMGVLVATVDNYALVLGITMTVYFCLMIAIVTTSFKLRSLLIEQMRAAGGAQVVAVAVVRPPNGRPGQPGPPPPPGFVTGTPSAPTAYGPPPAGAVVDPPPPYSQTGSWTTQQPGMGFSQPPAASSQPFAAFNQPGQNAYWNPAQAK